LRPPLSHRLPVPWYLKVQTQVAAAIAVLIATALGAVLVATTRLVTSQSLRRGSEDVTVARTAFNRLVAARADSVAMQVRILTAQPMFRALIDAPTEDDLAILGTMSDQYPRQLGAVFCIVVDRRAAWLAKPGWAGGEIPAAMQSAIQSAAEGRARSDIVTIDGRLFLIVSEPARFASETLGAMTAGLALDDSVARELAAATQSEVTLVAGRQISGSSLAGDRRVWLARSLEEGKIGALQVSPVLQPLGDAKYVSGTFPLTPAENDSASARLVLLRDWAPTQRFLDELQRQVLRSGLLVFACALIGGFVFSRRLSRPFQDIAAAARDISNGNWTRLVPVRGSAEAMTTASAFNAMTTSVRHWYEEAQARSERSQRSYERFFAVTESARDAIVSTDDQGAITFWNRSAAVIFGYQEREAIGQPLTRLVAPADRPLYLQAFVSLSSEAEIPAGRVIEMIGLRKDGTTFPSELSLSARQTDGRVQATAVIRDITERKSAEKTLQQREEQLKTAQKMEAIGRLAGGVAHDFNNLLTAITGFGSLVRDGLSVDDPLQSDIEEVLGAASRAVALTRQLLTFGRRPVVAPQPVALDRLVSGTEKMLRRLIGAKITLSVVSSPDLGLLSADPVQVEQVLINLCVNARDAMPDGGELRIVLDSAEVDQAGADAHPGLRPGRFMRLAVSDTGSGIDPGVLAHIFEPFFTTKLEGKGTGLGLATVYGIANQNGGHVEVETTVGAGTTFCVYFPEFVMDEACGEDPAALTVEEEAADSEAAGLRRRSV
jgi:PAS domain S-box-containing protein